MKILIATDGSSFSRAAIEKACDVAEERKDVSFKLVSISETAIPIASEPFAILAEYYQRLDNFALQKAQDAAIEAAELIRDRFPESATSRELRKRKNEDYAPLNLSLSQ